MSALPLEGASVRPTMAWRGRVIDAFGEPIDGKGPLPQGPAAYPLRAPPPPAHARGRVGDRLDLGVRAMNAFATCCKGQRLGVFAGSGVGKSVLLSMLAREAACDVVVVADRLVLSCHGSNAVLAPARPESEPDVPLACTASPALRRGPAVVMVSRVGSGARASDQ